MSLPDTDSCASDVDEPSDAEQQELRLVNRNPGTINWRRHARVPTQALAQAQIPEQGTRVTLTNYGSLTFLCNPAQYISGLATGNQGHTTMSSNDISRQRHQQTITNGGASDQDATSGSEPTSVVAASDEAPSSFIMQPPAWYVAGRCFSIWAPSEAAIHEGKFILLDSQNTEGRGVRVNTVGNEELRQIAESNSSARTRVLLKGSNRQNIQNPSYSRDTLGFLQQPQHVRAQDPELLRTIEKKLLTVYLDEYAQIDVHPGTFLSLSVDYNIPFLKYRCVDHGMLDEESFENLRFQYILNLVNAWRLRRRAKEYFTST